MSTSATSSSSSSSGGAIAKVLVVGNVATGKTSIINRFVRNKFSSEYQTTIGVDFSLKRVKINGNDLNVQLWDIAGQDRFQGLSRIFYTHAVAAIIVYDLFQRESWDAVMKWKKDMDSKVFLPSGSNIPVLLLGNKCDLLEESSADGVLQSSLTPSVSDAEIAATVKDGGFFAHFKCSAKSGQGIKDACMALIARIAANSLSELKSSSGGSDADGKAPADKANTVSLDKNTGTNGAPGGGGCCG